MNEIYEICKKIVMCLQNRDYDFLNKQTALCRVSEEDIKRCYMNKETVFQQFQMENKVQIYKDNLGLKVDLNLWIDRKRSDLTLQIEIKCDKDNCIAGYMILDILVM